MKKRYIKIVTEEQIQNCINSGAMVEVWVQNDYDTTDKITSNNEETLKIGSYYYFKSQCVFIAVGNYFRSK